MSPLRRDSSNGKTKEDDAELIFTPCQQRDHRRRCLSGEYSKDTNTPIPLSKRFASFGTPERIDRGDQLQCQDNGSDIQPQFGSEPQFTGETTIPVKDIIKVLTRGENDGKKPKTVKKRKCSPTKKDNCMKEECRQPPSICITTNCGSYDLLMESTNEQLVLLTFLKVNSTKGKVLFVTETDKEQSNVPQAEKFKTVDAIKSNGTVGESTQGAKEQADMEEYQSLVIEPNPSTVTQGTAQSSGDRSFDVEALTAKTMAERLKTDTLAEKLERRFYRLVSSLDDRK